MTSINRAHQKRHRRLPLDAEPQRQVYHEGMNRHSKMGHYDEAKQLTSRKESPLRTEVT